MSGVRSHDTREMNITKRLIVTTIYMPENEKDIYDNLTDTFKLSPMEIQYLNRGKELSVMEDKTPAGTVLTKVRIELVGAGNA